MRTLKKIVHDNIKYMSQTMDMARINQKRKYRGSDVGFLWSFVTPMMYICVFYFAIELGFKGSKDISDLVCPYFIWMSTGIVAWFYIRDMITEGANCFLKNRYLIVQAQYPIRTIPTIAAFSSLWVHLLTVMVILVLALLFGVRPSIYWLELPVFTVLMVLFETLWAFAAGLITVVQRDFLNLLKSVKTAFFWLSGILFDPRNIDTPGVQTFFKWNPITFIVGGYRDAICYHKGFASMGSAWICFGVETMILLVLTVLLYRKLEKSLPDLV